MKIAGRISRTTLLSAIVGAVALSAVPLHTVQALAATGAPAGSRIYALDDRIDVTTQRGASGKAQFALQTEHPWYRAIKVIDRYGVAMEVQKADGRYRTSEAIEVDPDRLGSTVRVEFWKAKFLGAMTKVHDKTFNKAEVAGQRVTFRWWEGEGESATTQPTLPDGLLTTGDGDRIRVSTTNGLPERVQIRFGTARPITWWKSVKVFDNRGQAVEIKRQDGKQLTDNINLPRQSFDSTIRVEFWKAKFLGSPTRVYTKVYNTESFAGRIVFFNWEKD
jgi:hypothetical protein